MCRILPPGWIFLRPYDKLFGEDGFPFATVGAVVFLVFLSGYLIIYNVFQISVKNDIRAYGPSEEYRDYGKAVKGDRPKAGPAPVRNRDSHWPAPWVAGRQGHGALSSGIGSGGRTPEVLVSTSPWIFLTAVFFLPGYGLYCLYASLSYRSESVSCGSGADDEGSARTGEKRPIRSLRGSWPWKI